MKQKDWNDWRDVERLQMDQYVMQNMFDDPGDLPNNDPDLKVLPMIWTYLIKTGGQKKARCVANGAPHLKESVTLANTYAACLEQTGARIFCGLVAYKKRSYTDQMHPTHLQKHHHQKLNYIYALTTPTSNGTSTRPA